MAESGVYKAIYYNGLSSNGHPALVKYNKAVLIIYYKTSDKTNTAIWNISEIRADDFARSNESVRLQYGPYPYQVLETNPKFISLLERNTGKKLLKPKYNFVFKNKKNLIFTVILSLALLAGIYFFVIPFFGDIVGKNLPFSYEKSIGSAIYSKIIRHYTIDEKKTAAVRNLVKNIKLDSKYPVTVTVVHEDRINAFAVMGGNIIIFDKILKPMNNYNQLAALIGHEYAHIRLRHTARLTFRSLAGYLLISMLLNDMSGMTAVILQNANTLKDLHYSRGFESEADNYSMKILAENHLNPDGMPKLLELLEKEIDSSIPAIISAHPSLTGRIKTLNKKLGSYPVKIIKNKRLKYYWEMIKR